jgi:ATP-dependent phosphofructokinase / diphosphate-dependent phosphofructokinase
MEFRVKRIGILTAGGDTPALNATIFGAVERANALRIDILGIQRGYAGLLDPRVPHVHLNPLYTTIPELDPCRGGTLLGSSRTYIDCESGAKLDDAKRHLAALKIDGLICIGGDGTINGMQPIVEFLPCVLAPKTIDNDLGLNYIDEPNEWTRPQNGKESKWSEQRLLSREEIRLSDIINYATPGYATAVFVVAQCLERIRTTAESHRRIAVVEVMGRQSGYIALGSAYGQPDLILLPEVPVNLDLLETRLRHIYELQQHAVIVVGEGLRGADGSPLGSKQATHDPAGNVLLEGAATALQEMLAERFGSELFLEARTFESASSAMFKRKVGHTQRGGRPILFDRFYASQLGGKAVDLISSGETNMIATLKYDPDEGFTLRSVSANKLRDRWGEIHPREVHPSMYDMERMQPSVLGMEYLKPIFTNAIGWDDMEFARSQLFSPGNLTSRYQSVNTDIQKRIRYL